MRANAGGTVFCAVINDGLYLGAVSGANGTVSAAAAPRVFTYAREPLLRALNRQRDEIALLSGARMAAAAARRLQQLSGPGSALGGATFTVTARVAPQAGGAAVDKPPAVHLDLGPLGGPRDMPMYDDGKHGDGRPGDGVYGASFQFRPNARVQTSAGGIGVTSLTVTVVGADGKVAGAAVPLAVYPLLDDLVWWDEPVRRDVIQKPEAAGSAAAQVVEGDDAHSGTHAIKIDLSAGPWSVRVPKGRPPVNAATYDLLSFWVKTDGKFTGDLFVQLEDNPELATPERSGRIAVTGSDFIRDGQLDAEYREVVIPVARFLKEAGKLQPSLCAAVVLSGQSEAPAAFWLDEVRLIEKQPAEAGGASAAGAIAADKTSGAGRPVVSRRTAKPEIGAGQRQQALIKEGNDLAKQGKYQEARATYLRVFAEGAGGYNWLMAQRRIVETFSEAGDYQQALRAARVLWDACGDANDMVSTCAIRGRADADDRQERDPRQRLHRVPEVRPRRGGRPGAATNPLAEVPYPDDPEREKLFAALRREVGDSAAAARARVDLSL